MLLVTGFAAAAANTPRLRGGAQQDFPSADSPRSSTSQPQTSADESALPRVARLSNGLSIVIVEDHSLPLVSVQLWYRAGSRLDPPDQPGVASAARRLLADAGDAALRLRALGAKVESATIRDASCFASIAPREAVSAILAIEAQRMRFAATASESAVGKSAAEYESRSAYEQPVSGDSDLLGDPATATVAGAVLARLFEGHPYAPPRHGAPPPAPGVVPECVRRWFVAGNATLIVSGDVAGGAVLDEVRRLFGDLPWTEPPAPADAPLPDEIAIAADFQGGGEAGVCFGWLTPGWAYFENTAIDALFVLTCDAAHDGLAARLRRCGAGAPRWSRYEWRDLGALLLFVPAEAPLHAAVQHELAAALESAPVQLPEPAALHALRAALWREAAAAAASFADRARLLGMHEVVGGDVLLSRYDLPRTQRLGVRDVGAAALRLARERRVILRCVAGAESPTTRPAVAREEENSRGRPALPDGAEALDGGEALALLAAASNAAAPLAGEATPPTVRFDLPGATELIVSPLAGYPQAAVRTIAHADSVGEIDLPAGLADYLVHHGMRIEIDRAGSVATATGACPAALVPQMLEMQWRCLPPGPHRIAIVVGEVEPAALADAVRRLLDDEPPAQPRPPAGAATDQPVVKRIELDSGFRRQARRAADGRVRIELGAEIPLAILAADGAAPDLAAAELAWLMGAPSGTDTSLDASRRWRWTCDATAAGVLVARTQCTETDADDLFERLKRRLTDIHDGKVPPAQVATARRLARAAGVLARDGPAAIAEYLADAEIQRRWPAERRPAKADSRP
ncbi:MAG: hypothetical protein CHACPFDD_01360 [Phycisphaerae bacterium]|nr:hypothetical protein [Phycisphaerae bacterium]